MVPIDKDYVPPEGLPSLTYLNERIMAAVNRLQVRGVMPQPNPLVTAWQVRAIVEILSHDKPFQVDDFAYYTAYFQMQDLERLVEEKPATGLVVPQSQRSAFIKTGN